MSHSVGLAKAGCLSIPYLIPWDTLPLYSHEFYLFPHMQCTLTQPVDSNILTSSGSPVRWPSMSVREWQVAMAYSIAQRPNSLISHTTLLRNLQIHIKNKNNKHLLLYHNPFALKSSQQTSHSSPGGWGMGRLFGVQSLCSTLVIALKFPIVLVGPYHSGNHRYLLFKPLLHLERLKDPPTNRWQDLQTGIIVKPYTMIWMNSDRWIYLLASSNSISEHNRALQKQYWGTDNGRSKPNARKLTACTKSQLIS